MKNFVDAERFCQTSFQSAGCCFFVSTSGKDTPLLFSTEEDFIFVMNVIAQVSANYDSMKVIAFEVMNNHFHFVIACESEPVIEDFFLVVKKRLFRHFPLIRPVKLDIRPILDLNSIRSRIVYTHRNGYVANPDHTPFSYKWGTGRYYFNEFPIEGELSKLKVDVKRNMFRGRDPKLPPEWKVIEDYVAPTSFCAIRFGMSLFRDAHHYFSAVSKNVEAYSGIAGELDDGEYLTDQELFSQLTQLIRNSYHVPALRELTKAQRLDLARILHYDYRSSNGQIRRVLGLTQYEVDSLFPMSQNRR